MELKIFASPLHDPESVINCRRELIEKLRAQEGGTACFIATGGTESLFREALPSLTPPIRLIGDGYHNSFAASFEIASYLRQMGIEHTLENYPLPSESEDVAESPYSNAKVLDYLKNSRVGLIGGASDWLIASDIDRNAVTGRFGAEFIDIPISEVEAEYRKVTQGERPLLDTSFQSSISDAERMYKALKRVVEKYRLTALTLKCFDLLGSCKTTACLALAKLNDEGVVSGCEGDLPSLWTMMVCYGLNGKAPFMSNPSSSNADACTVDFAHCTVPLAMCESYRLDTHFESGIGVGVRGKLPVGRYRLYKIGGKTLEEVYCCEGTVLCNTDIAQRCRTQIRLRFDSHTDFDSFMNNRLGNHVILVPLASL